MDEKIIYNISDIEEISKLLLKKAKSNILCLSGQLGSGKTTLVKSFIKALGAEDAGGSPTFSIVNEYRNQREEVIAYHIDCYRLEGEEEALEIGIEDYLSAPAPVFIEWPERILGLLPEARTEIRLEVVDASRRRLHLQNVS